MLKIEFMKVIDGNYVLLATDSNKNHTVELIILTENLPLENRSYSILLELPITESHVESKNMWRYDSRLLVQL